MATLGLAACGSDKKTATSNTTATSGSTATSGAAPSSTEAPTKAPDVAVSAAEYSYSVPSEVPGGVVKLTLTNKGKEPHDFQLLQIDGTHTKEEITKVIASEGGPIPVWLHPAGGVGTVGPGAPPGVAFVTLKPKATYWYICTESTDQNKAHSELGMIGSFTTTDKSPESALPDAGATVKAREYGFDVSGIKAGEQLVKFTNTGPNQIHHFIAVPLAKGKTLDDAKTFLASQGPNSGPPSGEPPVDFTKGVAVGALDPGGSEVAKANFEPGDYVFLCFLTDHAGGPPHFEKGMITQFTVS
ncbi:MAG: hypothetical protein ACR2GF_02460 [Acidimicrobiales bacterium]